MATINPFYRFESGWNAGFYPDNLVISNLLDELHSELASWLPANAIGLTIDELFSQVTAIVNEYNIPPNYGDLLLQINYLTTSDFVIIIYNQSLIATDDTQAVIIVGFNDSITNIVISATLSPFAVGAYSGTFDAALINTEQDVARALLIADQNGSAFFPSTYTYNPTTGVATSGLARGKNWKLNSDNNPSRFPANTSQYQNARIFSFSEQPPDEKYIVSLMEKIIGASLVDSTYSSILALFNSITVPDGWDKTIEYSAVTSERVQINIYNSPKGYVYTLVGRLDGSWLWQRFFNRTGSYTPDGFLLTYDGSVEMPYEPLTPSSYLFLGWYYELDFCEFNSGCYESPEFYQMPAMPGDNLQFNINKEEANLEFLDSVKVGLFDENGMFIQNIGEAIKPPTDCDCPPCQLIMTYELDAAGWDAYLINVSQLNDLAATNLNFAIYKNDVQIEFGGLSFVNPSNPYTITNIEDAGLSIIPPVVLTESGGVYTFTCTIEDAVCGDIYRFENQISDATVFPTTWITVFASNSFECPIIPIATQFNTNCLIPFAKAGCYRFGLYEDAGVDGFYLYSISNIIRIDASDCFSTIIEYWSDNNSIAQGFEYYDNWRQRIRLGINGGGDKPIITESIYRQSNGVHRRPQNKQDLSVDLHTDFLDRETQLALVDATRHPYFVWNDRNIFVKGDIEVATIQDFSTQSSFETLAQVKFQALVQGFQPKNSSCITC
jgi:hypothetical protein